MRLLSTCAALLVASVVSPLFAAEAEYVAAAEKEGQVVVFGDLNALPALAAGFQAKYPKVKLVTTSGDAWQLLTRFMNERTAGRAVLDVFFLAEDVVTTADNAGALAKFSPDSIKGFPASSLPSKNGTFALGNIGVMMLAWNKDGMAKKPLPKDWLDFATPKKEWDGLVAISNPSTSSATFAVFSALYQHYGAEKAGSILRGLKQANAEPTASIGVQNTKVQTGERPLAFFMNSSTIGVLKGQGTPIDFAVPASGAIAQSNAVALTVNAPHPNAGKLFIEYALSEEGQKLLLAKSLYPARGGLPPPPGMPPFGEIRFMPLDLGKAIRERDPMLAWWNRETGFGPK